MGEAFQKTIAYHEFEVLIQTRREGERFHAVARVEPAPAGRLRPFHGFDDQAEGAEDLALEAAKRYIDGVVPRGPRHIS